MHEILSPLVTSTPNPPKDYDPTIPELSNSDVIGKEQISHWMKKRWEVTLAAGAVGIEPSGGGGGHGSGGGQQLLVEVSNCWPSVQFVVDLPNSGGVQALELRIGDGETPLNGDKVIIHYYGRLAAKQGCRFDSTYDHKDENGEPVPFEFVLGSGKVISGIESAVRSMKVGGIRRVVIPPSEGYQNTSQEPIPPNFFDRQRLFTTIFNPTRLANGEGSTLGIIIFDIELLSLRRH
ncbi:hypothetical protein ABFX02_03G036400 [Erythranthe guttata]